MLTKVLVSCGLLICTTLTGCFPLGSAVLLKVPGARDDGVRGPDPRSGLA